MNQYVLFSVQAFATFLVLVSPESSALYIVFAIMSTALLTASLVFWATSWFWLRRWKEVMDVQSRRKATE